MLKIFTLDVYNIEALREESKKLNDVVDKKDIIESPPVKKLCQEIIVPPVPYYDTHTPW